MEVAILKFKMASGNHGNMDGYLTFKYSLPFKLHLCLCSRTCQKVNDFALKLPTKIRSDEFLDQAAIVWVGTICRA